MHRKIDLCPYCFARSRRNESWYRCSNVRCKKMPDLTFAAYNGRAPELKSLCFSTKSRGLYFRKRLPLCPKCHNISTTPVCPKCHNVLPVCKKNHKTMLISVVGAADAGKSTYLAVLLHELKRKFSYVLHGTAAFMDEESARFYEDRYLQYLYPRNHTNPSIRLPKTKPMVISEGHMGVVRPVMMNFEQNKEDGGKEERFYTFAFYDEAGEDFEEENVMFTVARQIAWSDAILFFLDPLELPYIRKQLSHTPLRESLKPRLGTASDPDVILLRLAKVLRMKEKKREEDGIDVPIAVIIPKLDLLPALLPRHLLLLRESIHKREGAYVRQEGFDIHEELCELMFEWGEQEFMSHLVGNFNCFQLFAVSSLGNNPDEYGRFFSPRPIRVEDPFFWIMKELKIIKSI